MTTARQLRATPALMMLITANALPVYGAITGRLVFFQVIYLYWLEALLLVFFDAFRIACARGRYIPDNKTPALKDAMDEGQNSNDDLTFGGKLRIITQTITIRVALLLFYLIFIFGFIAFQVTDKSHRTDVDDALFVRGPFASTAIWAFVISNIVQTLSGFFFNGRYRIVAPRSFVNLFSGRIVLLHFMIVISAVSHEFLFAGKTYASFGEVVYIGIFMLLKTLLDLRHIRSQHEALGDSELMPAI